MSLRTKSRIPASTSETAARLSSTSTSLVSVSSIFGMTFIGHSPVSRCDARACPPHDELTDGTICAAEFDSIAAKLRQCWFIPGEWGSLKKEGEKAAYQLFLKPALMLLLVVPCAVSPIEPDTVTPPNSFCSAPTLRSHLSSEVDRVCPAVMLVPVSVNSTLADCSVS